MSAIAPITTLTSCGNTTTSKVIQFSHIGSKTFSAKLGGEDLVIQFKANRFFNSNTDRIEITPRNVISSGGFFFVWDKAKIKIESDTLSFKFNFNKTTGTLSNEGDIHFDLVIESQYSDGTTESKEQTFTNFICHCTTI